MAMPLASVAAEVTGTTVMGARTSPPVGEFTVTTGGVVSIAPFGVRCRAISAIGMLITDPTLPACKPGNVGVFEYSVASRISMRLTAPSTSESWFSMARIACRLVSPLLRPTSIPSPYGLRGPPPLKS